MTTALTNELPAGGLKSFTDNLRMLGPAKLAAMGLVSVGMLCMLAVLMLRGSGDGNNVRMALLYGDLDTRDAAQMVDALEKAHIPHELNGADDQLMVPMSQVAAARLLLAKSNLPSGGSIGYEIFDRGDGLTSTQFQQEINQTRALEGELVRSIILIQGVRGARVHLVLPHRDLFASDAQPAQASVLLTMRGTTRLDPEAIQAVLNLVSSAVPGLKPQAIAIVDNRGDVLARNGSTIEAEGGAATADDLRQAMELRLSREIEDMLDASLGPDKVRAESSVTLDSAQINETQETFNPDQQVLRSQQTSSDKSRNTEAQQNTSVQNNLPNADAGRVAAGSQDERREETSNYEVGRTTRVISQSAPRIARISLAVLVDGETLSGPHGPVWKPRDAQDLARIKELVKSAIGFDERRGDTVTVESMRFDQEADTPTAAAPATLLGLGLPDTEFVRLAQTTLIGLVALTMALFIFRPMIKRLLVIDQHGLLNDNARAGTAGSGQLPSGGSEHLLLAGPAGAARDRTLEVDGDHLARLEQRQLAARTSSARRLGELVEQYPEESISLFRTWLTEGTPSS